MNNPADDNNGAMDDLWAGSVERTKINQQQSAADAQVPAIWRW